MENTKYQKTIAVILPINNKELFNEKDLESYQSDAYRFKLHYIDTPLKEIVTMLDVASIVLPLTQKVIQVVDAGADAIVIYAFGEPALDIARNIASVPVMTLMSPSLHMASTLCRYRFTVLIPILGYKSYVEEIIFQQGLGRKFIAPTQSINVNPAMLRTEPTVLPALIQVASDDIMNSDIDTFVLGCGGYVGHAKPLETALREKFQKAITVIDPIDLTFRLAMSVA